MVKNTKGGKVNGVLDWSDECHNVYTSNRAFKASFWLVGNISLGFNINGVFSNIFMKAQHRKQNWLGLWSNNSTSTLTLSWNWLVQPNSGGTLGNINNISEINTSEIAYVIPLPELSYVRGSVTASGNGGGCTVSKNSY